MKKFSLLSLLFLVFNIATAQQEISTAYATEANNMFAPLDKTKVPHGILLDFGMEFTNLKAYNGTLTDSTAVDAPALKNIYNTLFSSRIVNTTTGFINPNSYESNWNTHRTPGIISISGIYFKYASFTNDAINANKVNFTNNQFQDKFINGVWQNPYQEFQTFAMTPAINSYEGLNLQVKIPSTIFYSNYQSLIQSIQIDFDNGLGYVSVPFNQNTAVNYTTEGVKTWKYKINLTNGTSLLSQSKIEITQGITTIPWGTATMQPVAMSGQTTTTNSVYSHSITATKNFGGTYGTVKLTIDDTNNDGIRRPLIVAEGFDAGIILAPETANGTNTYSSFRKTVQNSFSSELQNLIYNSNKQYDIIYVDWDNGVDYLQKNAFALEAVIAWVNSVKIGTEKNVVLGQSMGGVIARYAMADMEQTNLAHNTRLFVSHDAPQQGANIPVSVQHMFRHLTNLYNQFATPYGVQVVTVPLLENSILDQSATKQMLMNWVSSNNSINNTTSSTFYNELRGKGLPNSGGYPLNCRNIAISNGAECGITQGFNAGDDLISFYTSHKLSFLQNFLVPFVGIFGSFGTYSAPLGVSGLVGLLPGSSRYTIEFNAKSIPYGSGNQIYKGRISYTKTIFKIFGWSPKITVNITNVQRTQPTGVLPIDHYAGGKYDTSLFTSGSVLPNGVYVRDKFNFIPTTSALDIGKGNVSLNDADYKMPYVGATPPLAPKNSPFANFSTDFDKVNPNSSNKNHISFNSRNGEWLAKELSINQNNPIYPIANCSYMCVNTQITGVNNFCTSATYSVPSGGTFNNWTITQGSNLVTLTGNGTPNVTITALPEASGEVILSLTMGDNGARCGNITLTKTIWVGVPNFNNLQHIGNQYGYNPSEPNLSISPDGDGCNQIKLKAVFDSPSILEYQWEKITTDVSWSISPNSGLIYLYPQCNQNFSFKVRSRNSCGWSEWYQFDYFMNRCTIDCNTSTPIINTGLNFTLNPNPVTNDILNITVKNNAPWFIIPVNVGNGNNFDISNEFGETNYQLIPNISVNISIFNQLGAPVLQFPNTPVHPTPAELDVSSLQAGTYVVVFEYEGQVESYTIIKN